MMDGAIRMVVGTDTGVGKTTVSCGLARAASQQGHRILALKPWESGCATDKPSDTEDGVRLAAAAGQEEPSAALVRLRAPLAPPWAGEEESVTLDFDAMVRNIRLLAHGYNRVIVEAAGGLLSPLTWTHNALDLARALESPLILVGRDALGTLNHTALAWTHARREGHRIQSVILSAPETPDSSTGHNQHALLRMGVDSVLTLPRTSSVDETGTHLQPVIEELWP